MTDEEAEAIRANTFYGACERLNRACRELWRATGIEPHIIWLLDRLTSLIRKVTPPA